tara:strand:- start:512 stop:685 length:174 start_codon:yes stop_codon:yes gene_type:complete
MNTPKEIAARKWALEAEIEILKGRLRPHDTGSIHTTLFILGKRIEELEELLESAKRK